MQWERSHRKNEWCNAQVDQMSCTMLPSNTRTWPYKLHTTHEPKPYGQPQPLFSCLMQDIDTCIKCNSRLLTNPSLSLVVIALPPWHTHSLYVWTTTFPIISKPACIVCTNTKTLFNFVFYCTTGANHTFVFVMSLHVLPYFINYISFYIELTNSLIIWI